VNITSINPKTAAIEEDVAEESTPEEVDELCRSAAAAAPFLHELRRAGRASLLRSIAEELEASRDRIVAIADRETALGTTRLQGELTRTCYQLRLFAEVLEEGSYLEVTIDHRGETDMGPRPDLRRMLVPLGPVAVFGASNFPLAFSVPGGDTAAALAAGCPVVVKAHPAHPATSRLTYDCLARAVSGHGGPTGTVGLVFGQRAGQLLVQDPHITAVGFTGSEAGGRALFDLASARPDPIPFYGELGSINSLVVTPGAARKRAEDIAAGYVASITLGGGQFCTKPGLAFVPADDAAHMRKALIDAVRETEKVWLLSEGIRSAYLDGVESLAGQFGVELVAGGAPTTDEGFSAQPALFWTTTEELRAADSKVAEECFGPAGVVVQYADADDLAAALNTMPGALAASIHAEDDENELSSRLIKLLLARTGRLVWNGFPTGVAVSWAMTHGGPYPSSTSVLHTSVGATSIRRFLRPVTLQSVPAQLLPAELRDDASSDVPQRINGVPRH